MADAFAGRVAARTGHGVDAEISDGSPLAAADGDVVLPGRDLRRHDVVVLVVEPGRDLDASAARLRATVDDLERRMTVGAAVVIVVTASRSGSRTERGLDRFADLLREQASALTPVVRIDAAPGAPAAERVLRWAEAVADVASDALIDPLVRSIPDDPFDEFDRVDAVRDVGRRYVDWTAAFQDLVDTARSTYGTRSAAMSIIDDETTRYFTRSGHVAVELPRGKTVCNRVMRLYGGLIVGDARLDTRFSRLPEVRSGDVRFYAGYRITDPDGAPFGALCVFDSAVRTVSDEDLVVLRDLAIDAQRRLWSLLAS
ncbi:GAF domain-containing protein [Amnibacterium kyonggiense]